MMNLQRMEELCRIIIPPGRNGEPSAAESRAPGYLLSKQDTPEGDSALKNLIRKLSDLETVNAETLQDAEREAPEAFALLVRYLYEGYYSDPEIVSRFDLPRSPQPGGHSLEPFDPSLLRKS